MYAARSLSSGRSVFVDPSIVADELAVQPGKSAKRRDPG